MAIAGNNEGNATSRADSLLFTSAIVSVRRITGSCLGRSTVYSVMSSGQSRNHGVLWS